MGVREWPLVDHSRQGVIGSFPEQPRGRPLVRPGRNPDMLHVETALRPKRELFSTHPSGLERSFHFGCCVEILFDSRVSRSSCGVCLAGTRIAHRTPRNGMERLAFRLLMSPTQREERGGRAVRTRRFVVGPREGRRETRDTAEFSRPRRRRGGAETTPMGPSRRRSHNEPFRSLDLPELSRPRPALEGSSRSRERGRRDCAITREALALR